MGKRVIDGVGVAGLGVSDVGLRLLFPVRRGGQIVIGLAPPVAYAEGPQGVAIGIPRQGEGE
jgi:hypothetical protein